MAAPSWQALNFLPSILLLEESMTRLKRLDVVLTAAELTVEARAASASDA